MKALLILLAATTAYADSHDDEIAQITSDPTIPTPDPKARPAAAALMKQGNAEVAQRNYEQGLADFLEAYARFPSPRILMNIGSTLFDMRRYADAANTYQRYLFDPIAQKERLGEVKSLLTKLDDRLTILTVRVYPENAQLSIDGGPFVAVAHALQTRVRPGPHTVRVKNATASTELTINGFEGEQKELVAQLSNAPVDTKPFEPDREWLKSSRAYAADDRGHPVVTSGYGGVPVHAAQIDEAEFQAMIRTSTTQDDDAIASGALGIMRIDGKGRGVAGGLGIAIAFRDHLEGELLALRSQETGAYVGGRFRFWTGFFRPYVGVGVPMFFFDAVSRGDAMSTFHFAFGARVAAGLELVLNSHLSVQADLGYEHFWRVDDTNFEANIFVPTVGVIGRL